MLITPFVISACGLKLKATAEHWAAFVEFAPTGCGLIGTVTVKLDPAQNGAAVEVGVTVYTTLSAPPVKFTSVSASSPVPAPAPPVRLPEPPSYTAVQAKVLATPFVISDCGLKLNATDEHCAVFVAGAPTGSDRTGTVIVNVAPKQRPTVERGVTVYTALRVVPLTLVKVSASNPTPAPAQP